MDREFCVLDGLIVGIQQAVATGLDQLLFPTCAGLLSMAVLYGACLTALRGRYTNR